MTKTADTYRMELARGIYTRVATNLGCGRAHVCRVAKGERRSPRVEKALASAWKQIDREVKRFERELQKVAA